MPYRMKSINDYLAKNPNPYGGRKLRVPSSSPLASWLRAADSFIKSPEEIVRAAGPYVADEVPVSDGVYFIVHDGLIQYVGRSKNLNLRLSAHWDAWKFDAYYLITGMPEEFTGDLEEFYIGWLSPQANTRRWSTEMMSHLEKARRGEYGEAEPWVLSNADVIEYCGEFGVHLRYESAKCARILRAR